MNRTYTCVAALLCLASLPVAGDAPPVSGYPVLEKVDRQGNDLVISGVYLGTAARPNAQLGTTTLVVTYFDAGLIVAAIPASIQPGSYPLWVQSFSSAPSGPKGLWSYLSVTLGG